MDNNVKSVPFSSLGLSEQVLKAVEDMGYQDATPIQAQAIPLIIEGNDVIGQSQTGTGKTAAFSLPIIEDILKNPHSGVHTLILCPTRELAMQACEEILKFIKYTDGIRVAAVYGGQPIERQFKLLKCKPQIVVGTPGRVMDHMRRRTLSLSQLRTIVLDEADEMLSMGFIDDIKSILTDVPDERQTILFSATMPPEILALTEEFQRDPKIVRVLHKELTVEKIEQYYYNIPQGLKVEALSRLMDVYKPKSAMVFCNTKKQVDELVSVMQTRGYVVEGLHGDMKQVARDHVMNIFRTGKVDILVATDVAARGIDIDDIGAVFNYDIPQDLEYYVHRIGRTGRAGKSGIAFTFVTGSRELSSLKAIMKYTHSEIKKMSIPDSSAVMECRIERLSDKIRAAIEDGSAEQYINIVQRLQDDGMEPSSVAAALISLQMTSGDKGSMPSKQDDNLFERHEYSQQRRADGRYGERKGGRNDRQRNHSRDRGRAQRMSTIRINLGKSAKIAPGNIVGAIANEANISGRSIGRIEIFEKYSTLDVPENLVDEVLSCLNKTRIMGRRVSAVPVNEQY